MSCGLKSDHAQILTEFGREDALEVPMPIQESMTNTCEQEIGRCKRAGRAGAAIVMTHHEEQQEQ